MGLDYGGWYRVSISLPGQEFLLKDKFVEEQQKSSRYFYKKTDAGDLLHKLLKNGKVMHALLRVS